MSSGRAASSTITDPGPSQQQQQQQQQLQQPQPPLSQQRQQLQVSQNSPSESGENQQAIDIQPSSDPHGPTNTEASTSLPSTSSQPSVNGHVKSASDEKNGQVSASSEGVSQASPQAEADGAAGLDHEPPLTEDDEQQQRDQTEQQIEGPGLADDPQQQQQQWTEDDSHDLKRVKVYELIGSRWVDQGTAFCFGDFQDNEPLLIARAEADFNQVILSTTIRSNDVYQRQQDTLIVWTEPDGIDYALSFQDPEGCAEVWNFIQEVQRHMNTGDEMLISSSPVLSPSPSLAFNMIHRTGRLPAPSLENILDVRNAIRTLQRGGPLKERICEFIQAEGYIKAMIDVMNQAEDLESLEHLHALCGCIQAILMLNDHALYQHILEDDIFFGVVGMLEYDPEFPTHKANYREFLQQTSRFHQPIPIRDELVQRKVHHTYRLQYLKDVVLARAVDDSTFNVLNSSIIFNQIDIINHIQADPSFLREIVGMYMDEDLLAALGLSMKAISKEPEKEKDPDKMDVDSPLPSPEIKLAPQEANGTTEAVSAPTASSAPSTTQEPAQKHEVILLIQQLCVMGKNVQLPARMALFRALVDRGILFAVQWALSQPESEPEGLQVIAAAGEILTALLDHDLTGVRGHVLKQLSAMEREKASGKKIVEKETVLALMCRVLVRSRDLAVQSQVGESLKSLLENAADPQDTHPAAVGVKLLQRAKDDPGVEKFMDYFYKNCVETLFKPFGDVPEFKTRTEPALSLSRERTNLYLYLCDLLANFTLQHSYRSHFFILSSNISPRVASLLSAKDKHLRLAAFRFFRACLKLNNGNITKHLIGHDVFNPILDLTIQESRRDNLVSSTCQEFFEHIRRENMKELIHHCMTRYEAKIQTLANSPIGGLRFKSFIRRWEINIEPPPAESKDEKPTTPAGGLRRWGQGRLLEAEEENYFNLGDDEDDVPHPIVSTPPPRGNALKRKRMRGTGIPVRAIRSPYVNAPPTPPLGGLVDYDDGEETSGTAPSADSTTPSSPKATARSPRQQTGYFPYATNPADSQGNAARTANRQAPVSKIPTLNPTTATTTSASSVDVKDETALEDASWEEISAQDLPKPGLGAKRRRVDDDDELLEQLFSRSKRPSVGGPQGEKVNSATPLAAKASPAKTGEEGPKKIRVKLGAVGAAVASSSPPTVAPSCTGTKDGDNG